MSSPISPQNNRDLEQNILHFLVQIWWFKLEVVTSYRTDKLMIDGHTDTRRQRQYPKAKTGLG